MAPPPLYCPNEARRALARQKQFNGIDFLEVLDSEAPPGHPPQQTLLAHCLQSVAGLTRDNVRIEGGVRVRPVRVDWALPADSPQLPADLQTFLNDRLSAQERPRVLVVRTDRRGDFSTYVLRLILSPGQPDEPPPGFDPLLTAVDFSFKVECPSDFDCVGRPVGPPPAPPGPRIDYLAKDFVSFRALMLDRLAILAPNWAQGGPADLGIALVEVLAYAADYLSYYQDAVATEAYLGTARRRVSVRRHARLLDYIVGEGANARAWVCVGVEPLSAADGASLPVRTRVLTRDPGAEAAGDAVVFETLHEQALKHSRNEIPLYTWGDPRCCLPRGATGATLSGSAAQLDLKDGDVLIFEEVRGPSGRPEDADPTRRHPVRLDGNPVERTDPLTGAVVLDVRWHPGDALPWPLCLWEFPGEGNQVHGASVARGNVVLADHGLSVEGEPLEAPEGRPYRPTLRRPNLTHSVPYVHDQARRRPAAEATAPDPRLLAPAVALFADGLKWEPRRDLLQSDRFARLRFGDDVLGPAPSAGASFTATYRVGGGRAGNVGAEALTRLVTGLSGVKVRNPLPAVGGADPEPLERVRLHAPQAFRTQERAVTEADYAAVAGRHPEVQRAAATRRWTGSWYTLFLTIDRKGGLPIDAAFEADLRAFLERFRMAGVDLEIDAPRFVSLDLALAVCVAPGYVRGQVLQALYEVFAATDLPGGRRSFFHPDNFTFGQPVFLSRVVTAAMGVPGVEWVRPARFRRYGQLPAGELEEGRIAVDRLEIVRLDNDPNRPENGKIEFLAEGGL